MTIEINAAKRLLTADGGSVLQQNPKLAAVKFKAAGVFNSAAAAALTKKAREVFYNLPPKKTKSLFQTLFGLDVRGEIESTAHSRRFEFSRKSGDSGHIMLERNTFDRLKNLCVAQVKKHEDATHEVYAFVFGDSECAILLGVAKDDAVSSYVEARNRS